jgi:hypothetical protein
MPQPQFVRRVATSEKLRLDPGLSERRREFIKQAAVGTGGVLLAPLPDLQTVTIPGFEGNLKNIRYRGKLLSIAATR